MTHSEGDSLGQDSSSSRRARPRLALGATLLAGSHGEARRLLALYSDSLVIVLRGQPRVVLFACPDRCGDIITVNVDANAGKAWRLRQDANGDVTLMPSVWRSDGCGAHFILWRSGIWWCGSLDTVDDEPPAVDVDGQWPEEMDLELREEWRKIRSTWKRG